MAPWKRCKKNFGFIDHIFLKTGTLKIFVNSVLATIYSDRSIQYAGAALAKRRIT
jgi:hypothetical protein